MSSKCDVLCEILLQQNVKLMTVLQDKTCSWKKKQEILVGYHTKTIKRIKELKNEPNVELNNEPEKKSYKTGKTSTTTGY